MRAALTFPCYSGNMGGGDGEHRDQDQDQEEDQEEDYSNFYYNLLLQDDGAETFDEDLYLERLQRLG